MVRSQQSLENLVGKQQPMWDGYLDGSRGASALFKLRVGDWDMGRKRRHWQGEADEVCRLCGDGLESIVHLVQVCKVMKENMNDMGWGWGRMRMLV